MKVKLLVFLLICYSYSQVSFAQTREEFFSKNDRDVFWLGIDYSHVQLIGSFAHFYDAGKKSPSQIKNTYFPGWNSLVLSDPEKFDIMGMIRRYRVKTDIEHITYVNQQTEIGQLQVGYSKSYSDELVKSYVSEYSFTKRNAFGILFIAESMDKTGQEAYFHFVVINLINGDYLFSARIRGEPGGFGIKNYWARAIYQVMKNIRDIKYTAWQSKYGNPNYVYDPAKEKDFIEEGEEEFLGGQGSCFAISQNGLFATNYHVIERGQVFHIVLKNDTLLAKIYLRDEKNDLAILKIVDPKYKSLYVVK